MCGEAGKGGSNGNKDDATKGDATKDDATKDDDPLFIICSRMKNIMKEMIEGLKLKDVERLAKDGWGAVGGEGNDWVRKQKKVREMLGKIKMKTTQKMKKKYEEMILANLKDLLDERGVEFEPKAKKR